MLNKNQTLHMLDLSENAIGLGGSIALSSLLMENKTIRFLNVCCSLRFAAKNVGLLFVLCIIITDFLPVEEDWSRRRDFVCEGAAAAGLKLNDTFDGEESNRI